jgi:hypothetical protein
MDVPEAAQVDAETSSESTKDINERTRMTLPP